ncbi:DUF995 domain-containing protein [Mesorhizobium sp. WSM3859]|uniref:DUF995 domain-containing protein n=1 Tax=Mesorhizobium sp. WSM3859 TaxID=2029402 RepID=UPI000BAFCFC8|nr:DUF995 domain-containing protein [Mesorhizobium sp. WSM3859]PBC11366.1 hypothetical protein CK230_04790 [Mesorhizobium sp. WSM3859]
MRTLIGTTAETTSPSEPARARVGRTGRLARRGWLVLFLVACAQLAFCGAAGATAAKNSAPVEAAVKPDIAPTAFELQLLYADRTWNWKNGAAYFGMDRRLHAWTKGEDSPAVGEGRWLVTEKGKMCMELAWRSKTYSTKPQRTCYSHRVEKGKIEQRKDPDGTWYDFKHAKDDPADEHQKFEAGNTKGAQFDQARKLIDNKS